jgi:hypothetical protein
MEITCSEPTVALNVEKMCCLVLPDVIDGGEKTRVQNCIIPVVTLGSFCAAYVFLCFYNPVHYHCNHSVVLLYSEQKKYKRT